MFDLIYDFIRNGLIGNTQAMSESLADNLSVILSACVIVLIFLCFVKLIIWAFSFFSGNNRFWGK